MFCLPDLADDVFSDGSLALNFRWLLLSCLIFNINVVITIIIIMIICIIVVIVNDYLIARQLGPWVKEIPIDYVTGISMFTDSLSGAASEPYLRVLVLGLTPR